LDHWERLIFFFPWVAVNDCSGCVVQFVVVGFVEILDAVRNSESFARERERFNELHLFLFLFCNENYAHRHQPVAGSSQQRFDHCLGLGFASFVGKA
jgi:hypothetical protein